MRAAVVARKAPETTPRAWGAQGLGVVPGGGGAPNVRGRLKTVITKVHKYLLWRGVARCTGVGDAPRGERTPRTSSGNVVWWDRGVV